MAKLKSTQVYGDLNVTGEAKVNGNEVFHEGNKPSKGDVGLGSVDNVQQAPITRTISSGTGLTGGGNLTADRTLNVSYGTAAGTAAQGNDSRLSNSREWTAGTISQAEAEAGTATTRRAFTAQRVRQAIVAWWNASAMKTKLDGIASGATKNATDAQLRDRSTHTGTQAVSTVSGLQTALASKAASAHTHSWNQVTEQPTTANRWPTFGEVSDKPTNYPTTWASVSSKPAQATRWPTWTEVASKPSTFTPSAHTHTLSQITDAGSVAALNTNASTANFLRGDGTWVTPPNTNTTYSEITTAEIDAGTASTLRTITGRRMKHALDKKADSSHTHTWSQVTGAPAQATRWPTFAEVTGKPIAQTTGTSTTSIMSQKATTDAIKKVYQPERAWGAYVTRNWTTRTAPNSDCLSVTWSPELGLFVAVSESGYYNVMTSPDGISWTTRTAPNSAWQSVTWSPELGLFVAVARSSATSVMTSPDGISWTTRTAHNNVWQSVTWSPELGLFVAVSESGTNKVMTSPDGISWTARTAPNSDWQSVTWSPELGLFVAVSESSSTSVMTSPDGISWTGRVAPNNVWQSVTWSPELGIFVAVSYNGSNKVMTSPDGISWTGRTTPDSNCLSVTWSPELGLFVVVSYGSTNNVMTSPDGISWTARTAPDSTWQSVTWSPELGIFVAVSSNGTNEVMTTI